MIRKTEARLKPSAVKKFYFLEYFYIVLKSLYERQREDERIAYFKIIKDEFQLGESRYRVNRVFDEEPSTEQIKRYKYTFNQVVEELRIYGLIIEDSGKILLSDSGLECIRLFEEGSVDKVEFKRYILNLMEQNYLAFQHLMRTCYKFNSKKGGLLLFPIYSPRTLGFDRKYFVKYSNILEFIQKLNQRIIYDVNELLGKKIDLEDSVLDISTKLYQDGFIKEPLNAQFDKINYNIIIKRIRDFYLGKMLKIYEYPFSYDTFNVWAERGKKLKIIHATDFYPGINGRIVYPTSVLSSEKEFNENFVAVYEYFDQEKLCIHSPRWDNIQEEFVKSLVEAYFAIKRIRKTHFLSLLDVKEKVCFSLRISALDFDNYIGKAYDYSIQGKLTNVQISLEADKLPSETTAMYLKREPILIGGKQKNIIAINFKKA